MLIATFAWYIISRAIYHCFLVQRRTTQEQSASNRYGIGLPGPTLAICASDDANLPVNSPARLPLAYREFESSIFENLMLRNHTHLRVTISRIYYYKLNLRAMLRKTRKLSQFLSVLG